MRRVVDTTFQVRAPIASVWKHLAGVERWPSWARHIKMAELSPPGSLTATSRGTFTLTNGIRSTFEMAAYEPPRRWLWIGPALGMRVHYDHLFQETPGGGTAVRFIVDVEGWTWWLVGWLFGMIYRKNLSAAVPLLIRELEA